MFLLMRAKVSSKKIICIILAIALTLFCAYRIWYVNSKAYQFSLEVYSVGEWVSMDGNYFNSDAEKTDGYSVRVSSAEVLTYEQFMERFGKDTDYLAEASQYDVVLLKIDFKNDSDSTDGGVYVMEYNLFTETRARFFNKSNDYMKIANTDLPKNLIGVNCQPGTEASMYFVYTTDGRADFVSYLQELEAKGTKNFTMYINLCRYPVKKSVKLELTMPNID